MFEAQCPSCSATYQVDERRVPDGGLKMRCPKCGESFPVNAPDSETAAAPVLGAALGLKRGTAVTSRFKAPSRETMPGVATPPTSGAQEAELPQVAPPRGAPRPAPPRRPPPRKSPPVDQTGSNPGAVPAPARLELAMQDVESVQGHEVGFELELSTLSPPSIGGQIDLPAVPGAGHAMDLPVAIERVGLPTPRENASLPELAAPRAPSEPFSADLPEIGGQLPDLHGELPDLAAELPQTAEGLPSLGGGLPQLGGSMPSPVLGEGNPEGLVPSLGVMSEDLLSLDPFGENAQDESVSLAPKSHGFELTMPPAARASEGPSLPPLAGDASHANAADDIFGHGPTTTPESIQPAKAVSEGASSFGEVDLQQGDDGLDDEFDAFPTEESSAGTASADKRTEGGSDGYGDVALDSGSDDLDLGADVERLESPGGLSSGAPIGAPGAAASAAVEVGQVASQSKGGKRKKPRRKTSGLSKVTRIALAGAIVLSVGGGALSLVPELGPYGYYWIVDQLGAQNYQTTLNVDVRKAGERLQMDTAEEVEKAFAEVNRGRGSAPRYRPRAAFAAYLGFMYQMRFGSNSSINAESEVLLAGLKDVDPQTRYLELARLTAKAAGGDPQAVVSRANALMRRGPEYVAVVGEAALLAQQNKLAHQAWSSLLQKGDYPRAHFGLARALLLQKKQGEARAEIDKTLKGNPKHAGARLLLAAVQIAERASDAELLKSLTPLSEGKGASPGEQVQALILLGEVHLGRARIKRAEEAFTGALNLDSGNAEAQRGLAQALFDSGRYSEALARFEASVQRAPDDLVANLGLVRSMLRLEQLEDAVKILTELSAKHPKSTAVAYWVGRGKESVGEKEQAEAAYQRAIEHGDAGPHLVHAYVALTRLLSQKGQLEAANEIISQAVKAFPDDPLIYGALGELATSRGQFAEAIVSFERAIRLDPENIGYKFSRAVAMRQARRFDEAGKVFDLIEKQSPKYPGLALERGNLFEASGRTAEALQAYESALTAAPDDLDLMLRVACGKAGAGQSQQIMKLIDPVLEKRAGSAEANFCKGLALLNGKEDYSNAQRFLERAVSRDAGRAKYHLYAGWVAMELKDYAKANVFFNKTIELDRTLADAYWKRGELRVRQGAVVDALDDLNKSLELAPSRLEAHASAARAFSQLGRENQALVAWGKAVNSELANPTWNREYGSLLLANRRIKEAKEQLEIAVTEGEKVQPKPLWLADTHRLLAMAIGRKKEAVPHWQAFIQEKSGSSNPYLREALNELNAILKNTGH